MGKRKFPRFARKPPTREERVKVLIVCEGRNTEPGYFEALRRGTRGANVAIRIVGDAGDPASIVRRCLENFGRADHIWAVFDRDTHSHFDAAVRECGEKNIQVAYSNPCFELWLVLHYEDYNRMDSSDDVQRRLEALCGGYDRGGGKTLDFRALMPRCEGAEVRAEAQVRGLREVGDRLGCPSTTVFELTRALRKISDVSGW